MATRTEASEIDQARAIAGDPELRDCLFLVSKGVPFDVAFTVDGATRLAWIVIFGELAGGEFNWSAGTWVKRE